MISVLVSIITLGLIIASAVIDAEHIKKEEYIKNHRSRWALRFIFTTPFLLIDWHLFLASGLLFWALFDHVLNIIRNKEMWYLGTESDFDKFWKRNKLLYKIGNVIMLSTSLFLFLTYGH